MNTQETNEKRIRNIIGWTDEDMEFYEELFAGIASKMAEIRTFAATIEGDIDAKMMAVKEKFPEQF
ncbi:MAG: hypothetical protein NT085_05165 [candidate division SR1 bacterium]|nr:hypothetical protein [candidate division SR1 bacterium]